MHLYELLACFALMFCQEFGFGFRLRTMDCNEEEMERLRQNKAWKKWKEAEKVASQSAAKSQAPSVSELFRTLW